MKKRYWALTAFATVALGLGAAAFVATPTVHEGHVGEAPELGRLGGFTVGTQELTFSFPDRVTFGKLGMATGQTETETRDLKVRAWYPADTAATGETIAYTHTMRPVGMEPIALEYSGTSLPDAAPLERLKFPLVIISHGFNGWNTQLSNLGEHIASRGYVVVTIDHGDMRIEGVTDFVHSFAKVLASRTLDQRGVIAEVLARAEAGTDPMFNLIDPENIGLIGYSMGGYGALATVGGDYDYESGTFDPVPSAALDRVREAADSTSPVDALVTFAPWGGQPDNRVWSSETLADVKVPVLMIAGSEDDVSNFDEGVSWIFDQLTGTQRHLLVFREARHNIAGNAFDLPEDAPFQAAEFVSEPVWRQGRINAINQHFVSAFLDLHLKGETDKAAYLDVPNPDANASRWDIAFGEQLNGTFAGEEQEQHWRGFQRRWAVGLEMRRKDAGE